MPALPTRALEFRFAAFALVGFEMGAEARDDFIFLALVEFFLHFFEREVNHIVMVQLGSRECFAEAQPEPVQ